MYIYSARAGASNSSVISVFKHIGLVKYRLAKNKSVEYAGKHILHISRPLLFFFFFLVVFNLILGTSDRMQYKLHMAYYVVGRYFPTQCYTYFSFPLLINKAAPERPLTTSHNASCAYFHIIPCHYLTRITSENFILQTSCWAWLTVTHSTS